MSAVYMLDTSICSFIMRERPPVLLERLQSAAAGQHRIVISAVTHYEMLLGTIGGNASRSHATLVEAFVARLSAILSWDRMAAEEAFRIRTELAAKGTPIGGNDAMIAGHAMAADCTLVSTNTGTFALVEKLHVEDWTQDLAARST